jgi:outer membrane protein
MNRKKNRFIKVINAIWIFTLIGATSSTASDTLYLSLSDIFKLSIKNSLDSKLSQFKLDKQNNEIHASRSLFYPDINLTGFIQKPLSSTQSVSIESNSPNPLVDSLVRVFSNQLNENLKENTKYFAYSVQIAIYQTIFDGGKHHYNLKVAEQGLSIEQKQAIMNSTVIKIKAYQLYWDYINLLHQQRIIIESKPFLEDMYRKQSMKVKKGVSTESELQQVAYQQTSNRLDENRVQNELKNMKNAILVFLCLPIKTEISIKDTVNQIQAELPEELTPNQVDSLADISLENQIQIEEVERLRSIQKMQSASKYPLLSGFASLSYYKQNNLFVNGNLSHDISAGLNLSWNIIDFGKRSGVIRNASIDVMKEEEECQNVRRQIAAKIIEAQLNYIQSINAYTAAIQYENFANEAFNLSVNRYMQGQISTADALDNRKKFNSAVSARITAENIVTIKYEIYMNYRNGLLPIEPQLNN